MDYNVIDKHLPSSGPRPNLMDYAAECARFSWDAARAELAGLPGGALNIAHEAVDRHASGPRATRLALRWLGREGAVRDFTYGDLELATSRFANVLAGLGVARGERVFVLAGRIPELYIAVLGALKRGCVVSPLFSAVRARADRHSAHHRPRRGAGHDLQPVSRRRWRDPRGSLPFLKHVLVVRDEVATGPAGGHSGPARRCWRRRRIEFDTVPTAARGSRLAAFHQRHDRQAQRRRARARSGGRPPRHRPAGARFSRPRTCSGARPIRAG